MLAMPALAQVQPFPPGFKSETISTNGTRIFVRVGGHGPAVVLLHGYGETGDMWAPLAAKLAHDHMVIVPDLRGMGLSSHPAESFGPTMAVVMRAAAANVQEVVIPRSGHWLMEENPAATIAAIAEFLQ